jgi:hypothetical protein
MDETHPNDQLNLKGKWRDYQKGFVTNSPEQIRHEEDI